MLLGPIMGPRETVSIRLWAQVEAAMPRMEVDSENCLRMVAGKSKKGSIILGDVAQSFIRALGPSDPPVILSELRFDEQRWEILASAFGVELSIKSEPYWGFGIFTRCFLNEICITGTRPSIDRIVFDTMASLGRNPWEPFWRSRFEKKSGADLDSHENIWRDCEIRAERKMRDMLDEITKLYTLNKEDFPESASPDIEAAKLALEDRNGQAFERAMSRALTALKMKKGFDSKSNNGGWGVLLEPEEVPVVDLTGD
tara:strand:- start:306 stop:1073 length:768 start_codon:yes stop_codon:yes gene_type:complete